VAKITNKTISEIKNVQEMLDFLEINMYEDENIGILDNNNLYEYIKVSLQILDFQTNYEMDGILTLYSDYNFHIAHIVESFEKTNNGEIANLLKKIVGLYEINIKGKENAAGFKQEEILGELEKKLMEMLDEKKYWKNVEEYIKENKEKTLLFL